MDEATFGAGCFWHVEEVFSKIKGVKAEVGYMGGNEKKTPQPDYETICAGGTGYAEVVHLTFDPQQASYEKLLEIFFTSHDPTQFHRQGPDVGDQYRSVIFYYNSEQARIARRVLKEFQGKTKKKIVTEIAKAGTFFRAEEYHQQYFKKHPIACRVMNIFAKV